VTWNNRVAWQEGMFLQAQHFQQQDRWTETLVRSSFTALRPHPWGLVRFAIAQDMLATGRVALSAAAGLFEDGTPFAAPDETALPPPLEIPPTARNVLLYLATRIRRPGAAEIADGKDEGCYSLQDFEAYDTHSSGAPQPAPLLVGQLRLRYLLETDDRDGYVCLPLARIVEVTPDRRVVLDERWIPPALTCAAVPQLAALPVELAGLLN
jgi:type VI secretion system protein ImpJ